MTKRLLILLLIGTAGALLMRCPGGPASDEELRVKALGDGYVAAANRFLKAGRTMGGLGLDTTSDAEAAVVEIKKVRDELAALMPSLTEENAIFKAEELKAKIDEFCRKNDIF